MALYIPPVQQQGLYRYNPLLLKQEGPARLFPAVGDDGTFRFLLSEWQQTLIEQGRVSEPLSLLLQHIHARWQTLDEQWNRLGTLLADWQILQSPWFNFDLPPGEQFTSLYVSDRKKMAQVLLAAGKAARNPSTEDWLKSIAQGWRSSDSKRVGTHRLNFYQTLEKSGRHRPRVSSIYERDGGLSDREFARQRLAGANPMVLRSIQEADRELIHQWEFQSACQLANGETIPLIEAANQNRLFLVEYPLFESLSSTELHPGRYVGNPKALFYQAEELHPVLIQLERGGKVFAPTGRADDWMRAKLYTQVADVTHHELISHLCYTHLAMEAFAIATPRQLPATHPLYRLLRPHFTFLLAINQRGNKILLAEGAAIDSLLAPTGAVSVHLMDRAYRERAFQDYALPNDIRQRGIDTESLPEFAYRDDASLLWEAIADYASAYLQQYYRDDQAVRQDSYLQAWAAELGAPLNTRPLTEFPTLPTWLPSELTQQTGLAIRPDELPAYARVPDFPSRDTPGAITSLQQLIDVATQIIFTCGPQHAAVNFSQFDYIGYVPNAPMAAYAKPSEALPVEQVLPSVEQEIQQMELTFALSGIIWSRLGDDRIVRFTETGDRKILQQFQARLAGIETEIQKRNRHRLQRHGVEYPYLLPSQIPNSINI